MKHRFCKRFISLLVMLALLCPVLTASAEQNLVTYTSKDLEMSFSMNSDYRVGEMDGFVWVYPGDDASNFHLTWVTDGEIDKEGFFRDTGEALRAAMGDSMLYDPGTKPEPLNLDGIAMDAMIYAYTDADSGQIIEGAYCMEQRDGYLLIFGAAYQSSEADAVLSALVLASRTFAITPATQSEPMTSTSLQDSADNLARLCANFADATARFSAAYQSSFGSGDSAYVEQMISYVAECEAAHAEIIACENALLQMQIDESDAERVFLYENTIEACRIAKDLLDFYIGYYNSSAPLEEYQMSAAQGKYTTEYESLNALYGAMGQVKANYQALRCPASMEQAWPLYIRQIDAYREKLYADYKATEFGDVLMAYSSRQLLMRQPYHMMRGEMILYSVLEQQFANLANMLGLTAQSDPQIWVDYSILEEVFPNLYPSMDSAINLLIGTNAGSARLLVEAEINGFTQKYQQIITATPEISYLMIKPPALIGLDGLNSERTTQITLRVTQMDTGDLLVMETRSIALHSIYDFTMMNTEFGITEPYNLFAWLRPDADEILALRREAISWLEANAGAEYNSLPGYQLAYPDDVNEWATATLQATAIQGALSDMGVRYNMGAYSFGGTQRILTPDKVIESRSGICVETALLMASALQSMDMHAMILVLPGHAQVALETWTDSGEYVLLETTKLPYSGSENGADGFVRYLTPDEWQNYLSGDGIYVIDCDLARVLDIRGLPYSQS